MAEWVSVIEDAKLKDNSVRLVFPKGIGLLLIRKAGSQVYAISNKCAHMGCPLKGGFLDGYIMQCPCHEWRFDIRSGEFLDAPEIKIAVYKWKAENGNIFVEI